MEPETSDVTVNEAATPYVLRHRVLLDLADGTILDIKDEAAGVCVSAFPKGSAHSVSFVLSNQWEETAFLDAVHNSAAFSRNRVDQA